MLGISLILAALFPGVSGDETKALVAFALFVTAIIFGVATISNNNLQDLKTGQLVEATPWRQQVALVLGVVFGAMVIPPILDLMNTAFTFQGAPGAKATALAAPQAAIISTIAQGVLGGNLDWGLIREGAIIGVVAVIVDEVLKRSSGKRLHLPPLAIGMGIYLPLEADLLIPFGAVLGWFYNRWAMQSTKPRLRRAHGRADGDRPDRRRKPDGRRLCLRRRRRGEGRLCRQRQCARAGRALFGGDAGQPGRLLGGNRRRFTSGPRASASDAPAPGDDADRGRSDLPLAAEHCRAQRRRAPAASRRLRPCG